MPRLGREQRADADRAQNLDCERSKRKRRTSPAPAKVLESVESRLDFGEQGRANASTLEDKCSANGSQMSGVVTVVETERNERKFVDTPTSSGGISGKACRARMESGAELRGVYHNSSAKTHRECNTHAFGGCKCGGMPGGAPAAVVGQGPSAKDCSSVGTGHAAGGTAQLEKALAAAAGRLVVRPTGVNLTWDELTSAVRRRSRTSVQIPD